MTPRSAHPLGIRGENIMGRNNAKRHEDSVDPSGIKISEQVSQNFVNSRGISMTLRAIPPYLAQMANEAISRPKPPTYAIELEGGGTEEHVHDETSIAQSSDAEKIKWAEYQDALLESIRTSTESLLNIILIEGVELEIDDMPRWLKKMELMHIPVSDDPEERLLAYKKAYVLGSKEDINDVTSRVMAMTGLSREDVNNVKQSFPDTV